MVDVSALAEIGDGITVDQLNYDKEKVELIDVEPDDVVAKIDYAVMEEEPEEEEVVDEAEALEGIEATKEGEKEDEEGSEEETEE